MNLAIKIIRFTKELAQCKWYEFSKKRLLKETIKKLGDQFYY